MTIARKHHESAWDAAYLRDHAYQLEVIAGLMVQVIDQEENPTIAKPDHAVKYLMDDVLDGQCGGRPRARRRGIRVPGRPPRRREGRLLSYLGHFQIAFRLSRHCAVDLRYASTMGNCMPHVSTIGAAAGGGGKVLPA